MPTLGRGSKYRAAAQAVIDRHKASTLKPIHEIMDAVAKKNLGKISLHDRIVQAVFRQHINHYDAANFLKVVLNSYSKFPYLTLTCDYDPDRRSDPRISHFTYKAYVIYHDQAQKILPPELQSDLHFSRLMPKEWQYQAIGSIELSALQEGHSLINAIVSFLPKVHAHLPTPASNLKALAHGYL